MKKNIQDFEVEIHRFGIDDNEEFWFKNTGILWSEMKEACRIKKESPSRNFFDIINEMKRKRREKKK